MNARIANRYSPTFVQMHNVNTQGNLGLITNLATKIKINNDGVSTDTDERSQTHVPIVHIQEEPSRGVVELIAQHLLQLTDQFVVIGCAHTTELLQK